MITERTVKIGEERFLVYIDDQTGKWIKQMPLDEAAYKNETIRVLTENHMRDNPGSTYSEALLAVSEKNPELFGRKASKTTEEKTDIVNKVRGDLINEFMDQNKDVSYKEAVLAVSEKRPDLFTAEARTWQ